MKLCILLPLFLFLFFNTLAQTDAQILSFQEKGFVENKGQVIDQHNRINPKVKFIYSNDHFNLELKENGFSYELFEPAGISTSDEEPGNFEFDGSKNANPEMDKKELHSQRIDVQFVNANEDCKLIPVNPTGINLNFYTPGSGENGITGVQSFNQVLYKNVYPGIDLKFSSGDSVNPILNYEWILHPNADPSVIKLKYGGAIGFTDAGNGGVDILTSRGIINEGKIYCYQTEDGKEVNAKYTRKDNTVGYSLERRSDRTRVIDPNISWYSFFGGSQDEDIFESEMGVDKFGKPLLVGNTSSTQYIASTGAYQVTYAGGMTDAFIAKFKSTGKLDWATYYGGTEKDGGHSVATDDANNIFVGGNTYSSSGIATTGSHQTVFGGMMDAWIGKFTNQGTRIWATYYGGEGFGDQVDGLVCDGLGNLYFTGYTASFTNISTPGCYQDTLNATDWYSGDVMLGEFTTSGNLVWCTYFSGPLQDRAHGIVFGKNSELYIEGTCESTTQFATTGVYQSEYGGGAADAFVAKWDTNGHLYWCSYYGGEGEEHNRTIQTDSAGNAYIVGWTDSETGIATPGSFQESLNYIYDVDNPDAYLAKFKPNGSLAWATYYGGKGVDRGRGIAIDQKDDLVYLVGSTQSTENVATAGTFGSTLAGQQDGFVAKFTGSGARDWGYYIGGGGTEIIFDAELDLKNFLYMYMITDTLFPTTSEVYQPASNGGQEIVLMKFNPADSCYDTNEPNNSKNTAKNFTISYDTTFFGFNGVISAPIDVDWFRFKTFPTNLKVELTDLAADYDLYLYKVSGQLISSSTNSGTASESIIYNNLPKGYYLIKVMHASGAFEPNSCYLLRPLVSSSPWQLNLKDANEIPNQLPLQVQEYPNPATDKINLKITSAEPQLLQATLYNLLHTEVLSSSFMMDEGTQSVSIDTREISSGIYLLQLKTGSKTVTLKVVIQN